MTPKAERAWTSLLLLSALAAAACLLRLSATVVLCDGVVVQGWSRASVRILYPAILAAAAAFSFAVWRRTGRLPEGSRLDALRPVAWTPVAVALSHAGGWIGPCASSLALPYGAALVAALCLERFLRRALARPAGAPPRRRDRAPAVLFAATAVLLFALWAGFAAPNGFDGGGDTKHYRFMIANLVERGNLDLTDRMDALMEEEGVPDDRAARADYLRRSHMRVNSKGRTHSYHSFGFPLLAWPFALLLGSLGDPILRALLGAFALVAVRASCLAHGAPRPAANLTAGLVGLSFVWVYTALSFLPEMLGFGLCAWAVWALAAQHDPPRRLAATCVAAVACAYLPVAHVRFAPTALALAGFFGIEGLLVRGEPFWPRKFPRLALYTAACFAGWIALWLCHASFYSGTSAYNYSRIAGREPLGMLAMFADRRGVAAVFPAVFAGIAAAVCAAFRGGAEGRRAGMSLVTAAGVLYCCCCTSAALSGACLNGRYFFPVVPVLLPFLAVALGRADRPGRVWMIFLALLPVLYFVPVSFFLVKGQLLRAPAPIRTLPLLQSFWEPFAAFFDGSPPRVRAAATVFASAVFAVSLLACARRRPVARTAAAAVLLAVAFAAGRTVDRGDPPLRANDIALLAGKRPWRDFRVVAGTPSGLFEAFRPRSEDPFSSASLLLADAPSPNQERVRRTVFVRSLAENDWAGRGRRWCMVRLRSLPIGSNRCVVACRVRGDVVRGSARLAVLIWGRPYMGDIALPAGPFDIVYTIRVSPDLQGINALVSLDGDAGEVRVDEFEVAPCLDGLQEALGPFPDGVTVIDLAGAGADFGG